MKKASKKLVLRGETVRGLVNVDLARVVGGAPTRGQDGCALAFDSGIGNCVTQAVVSKGICG